MAAHRVKDMTVGKVGHVLLLFALPFFFSSLLQNVYNLVDATLAGHFYGETALAAIGASSSIYVLVIMFANGLNTGFGIVLSRAFGSHDADKLKQAACTMLVLNLLISLILALLCCLLIGPVLRLLNTPEDIFVQARQYITIILAGLPVTAMYNMQSAMLRSLGNSRTPLMFLALSSCMNIVLDLAFVVLLDLGVAGIAFATVCAQLMSSILCFVHIRRHYPELHFTRMHAKPMRELYSEMFSSGMSVSVMMTIFNLGSVCIQSAINSLGTYTITAQTAARKLFDFMNLPQTSLSSALTTLVSQNYGAGKYDRCRQSWRLEILFALGTSALMILAANLFGPMLLRAISGSDNPAVLHDGMLYLRCQTAGFPILSILLGTRMYLQGVGSKIIPIASSIIELIGKVLFTFLIIPAMGFLGVCLVEPLLWVVCMLFLVGSFIRINRTLGQDSKTA